ncbi:hypothetical protein PFISCL1PPCAC_18753, partial [Pristionchus fissidentatus]
FAGIRWMSLPPPIDGCPPGLEFLLHLDTVVVRLKQEMVELFSSIEIPNRYSIETTTGDQIYFAAEDQNLVHAQLMGNQRGFKIKILDGYNRIAFTITRPMQYCRCGCLAYFDCCKRHGSVEGAGQTFGEMYTRQSCCSNSITITDANKTDLFLIDGPCCCTKCCNDLDFPV